MLDNNEQVSYDRTSTVIFPHAQPIPKGLVDEFHHPDQKNCCPVAQCSSWAKCTTTIPTEPSQASLNTGSLLF